MARVIKTRHKPFVLEKIMIKKKISMNMFASVEYRFCLYLSPKVKEENGIYN